MHVLAGLALDVRGSLVPNTVLSLSPSFSLRSLAAPPFLSQIFQASLNSLAYGDHASRTLHYYQEI